MNTLLFRLGGFRFEKPVKKGKPAKIGWHFYCCGFNYDYSILFIVGSINA